MQAKVDVDKYPPDPAFLLRRPVQRQPDGRGEIMCKMNCGAGLVGRNQ